MTTWQNRIVDSGEEDADQLLANPGNARIHPQFQQQALQGVLDSVGWVQRVIVNRVTGHVVDGHLRVALAITRNEKVPVDYVELTEDEEKLILASFDYITSLAVYDKDQLDTLLQQVNSDDAAVQALLAGLADDVGLYKDPPAAPEPQIDRAAELQQKWQVERGQLWEIGKHRLLCGDSTNADDVARLMGGERAAVCLTDPPYGMNLDTEYPTTDAVKGKHYDRVIGDNAEFDPKPLWDLNCSQYVLFGADYYCWQLLRGGSWFVWDKKLESLDASIGSGFELIWCYPPQKREVLRYLWSGFTATERGETRSHPTQKPLALIASLIQRTSGLIYDPFGGSGTTMVACEQLNRQCRMIEIEPKYCSVILERMSQMGLEPRLVE